MILPFGYSCIVCSLGMDGNPTCQVCTSDTRGLQFEADKCNGQYQDRKHGQVVCKESILNLWQEFDFITEPLETHAPHSLQLSINFKQTYWYILFVRIPRILPSMRHSLFLPLQACRDIVQLHHHSFVPSNPSGHMCIVDSLCLNWYSSTQPYSNKKFSSIIIVLDFSISRV